MYSYLTPDNVVETYKDSKQYTEGLTELFPEYERLARNKPHASIPKEYPKTTDGTAASIIRKTPHRIIQQLPTGKIVDVDDDWLRIIAKFIYENKIIPSANEGYALIQKCWLVVERFLTFGSCPTYTPFVEHNGYFCTDLRLPYWGDVFIQPGKLSDADSNYGFLRSWWQTKDIDALIDAQSKLGKGVQGTWNVENLKQIRTMATTKDEKAKTPAEREKQINTKGGIELITGFQRGVGAKFYTFHASSGLLLRTKVNKDPRGELPLSFAYGDVDGSNPFGRSILELVGSLQNLMDGQMQMHQYREALMLNPPLVKRGNWNKNKIKFAPNVIIDMGSGDPNVNSLEALKIDTSANANFANNYQLLQSQLFGLLSTPNSTISAENGGIGQSKTHAGVLASQSNMSVDDNYARTQFETWFGRWSETAINLYFAERQGIEEIQLDDKTIQELQAVPNFDPSMISPDGVIRLNFSSETPKLKFRVDANSSRLANDPAQVQIATGLLETVMKFPMLNKKYGGRIDVDELAEKIVNGSGIKDPDLVAPELTTAEKQAKAQVQQTGMDAFSPMYDKPQFRVDYKDVESPSARAKILELGGAKPEEQLPSLAPNIAEEAARGMSQLLPEENGGQGSGTQTNPIDLGDIYKSTSDPSVKAEIEQLAGLHPAGEAPSPDHLLKAHDQAHQQAMDKAKLDLEKQKLTVDAAKSAGELKIKQQIADKPVPKPAGAKPAKPKKKAK